MNTLLTLARQGWLEKMWLGESSGASTEAAKTEFLFMFVLWVNILSFAFVMAVMFYFVVRYRRSRAADSYQMSPAHHTPLELAWSIIPLLVMVPIFYWGFEGYVRKLAAPSDSEEISVRASKWIFNFKYRNGAEPQGEQIDFTKVGRPVPEFVVPAGRPVRMIMSSADVIHGFYIPDYRAKMDILPNRYISLWFEPQASEVGKTHRVFCSQYCGDFHSEMAAQIKVVSKKDFDQQIIKWLGPSETTTCVDYGKGLYTRKGCNACHSVDGSKGTGPTWQNIYGERHAYTNGEKDKLVDEDWLRENILYSQKRILVGPDGAYPPSMPVFAGQLSDEELEALICYIKSLSNKATAEDKAAGTKTYGERKAEAEKKK